jgi:SNF2 family DNA or RNA helicase
LRKHLPDHVAATTKILLWSTERSTSATYQREMEATLSHPGLVIVCMSYDGVKTETTPGAKKPSGYTGKLRRGYELAKGLLTSRPCMMVLDESPRIKNPGSKLTKRVTALSAYAEYRRILSGTPVDNSPFDVYAQVNVVSPTFWARKGCAGWPAFKTQYGNWTKGLIQPDQCPHPREARPNCGCKTYPILLNYRNLHSLREAVQEVGSRLLKTDVLDLPPKSYTLRRFDLGAAQRSLYEEVRKNFLAKIGSGLITAPLVITQMVRLQQIACGFVPDDDGKLIRLGDEDANPRIELLRDVVDDVPHKSIVWAKYQEDMAQISDALRKDGVEFVEYHGSTSATDRERARERFQTDESVRVFLANPACAGEGLTLHAARTVIYYNSNFRLAPRLQSEDRAHRIGQTHPVLYIDLVADRTIDEKIVEALRSKKDLANLIMGDPQGGWI